MNVRPLVIVSLLFAAAMVVFAFVTEARLPAGAELPIHWNAVGEPDDWAEALFALLIAPGVLIALTALFAIIPSIEPLQDRLEGSAPVLRASWIGIIFLLVVMQLVMAMPAWGVELPVNATVLATGLLFVILGNALPKSRPGFFVGIRTPWAITDTDNWIATHRLGGKLLMAAGAAMMLAAALPIAPETLSGIVIGAVLVAVIVPVFYSWWHWHSRRRA